VAAERALDALRAASLWPGLEIRLTEEPGHARNLAREAAQRGDDLVIAVGGDGTANEVAWGLQGSETTLGLLPVGSGNGLARTLRIPLAPRRAIGALAEGAVRRIDLGLVNGRPFLNVAGAGLDAVIGADFHAHGKQGGRRGVLTYVRLSLRRALSYAAESWNLVSDGGAYSGRALIVAFVNGRQYGGGAVLAPGARLDDGRLEIVIFEDAPLLQVVANAPRLFLGSIERFGRYRRLAASSAVLTATRSFEHHRDGEPEAPAPRLDVSVDPKALRILVPQHTAADPNGPFGGES
jgi:YegS/Rv2252/BmrU family lipid kinase